MCRLLFIELIAAQSVFFGRPCHRFGNPVGRLVVTVGVARQVKSPLQIVGFRLPQKAFEPPSIVLRNVSAKVIQRLAVEWISGGLNGEGAPTIAADSPWEFFTDHPDPAAPPIKPGSHYAGRATLLRPGFVVLTSLATPERPLRSPCIYVFVMVSQVDFADGTVWDGYKNDQHRLEVWRKSFGSEGIHACDGEISSPHLLENFAGVGVSPFVATGSPTHLPIGVVQSYTFACPLVTICGGKIGAPEPW